MNVEKIKRRHISLRIVWAVILSISLIVTIILIPLFLNDPEIVDRSDYIFSRFYIPVVWSAIATFYFASVFLLSFRVRCITYKINTHYFYVCVGFFIDYLILDSSIVDKTRVSLFTVPPMKYDFEGLKINVKIGFVGGVEFKVNGRYVESGGSLILTPVDNSNTKTFIQSNETLTLARELEELESLRQRGIISDVNFKVLKDELVKKHIIKK